MPLAMQSPPQLVLWSSLEMRRRRPCIVLEQVRRQRPEGRLAVLQTLSFHAREKRRVIECCFRVRCRNHSRLQVAIAGRRARRIEGGTLQRGVSDETTDHGNKQNRLAGNAWHAARTGAARRLPQPQKSMGLCRDHFALANHLLANPRSNSCQQTSVFKFKIVFLRGKRE